MGFKDHCKKPPGVHLGDRRKSDDRRQMQLKIPFPDRRRRNRRHTQIQAYLWHNAWA